MEVLESLSRSEKRLTAQCPLPDPFAPVGAGDTGRIGYARVGTLGVTSFNRSFSHKTAGIIANLIMPTIREKAGAFRNAPPETFLAARR